MIPLVSASDVFDEATYLNVNPDVFVAVRAGSLLSGFEHCLNYGLDEHRPGIPLAMQRIFELAVRQDADGTIPPEALRTRVHGSADPVAFDLVGRVAAASLACTMCGRFHGGRVLDFGCGCGRVLRHLRKIWPLAEFSGSDVDREAIHWCQKEFIPGDFTANADLPPLSFPSESFAIVYAVSVFSHLPEDMQFLWLEELCRITRPGGYLLISVHGKELFPCDQADARDRFATNGFHYSFDGGTSGLPQYYGNAYHSFEYMRKNWSPYVDIVAIVRRGIAKHQDLVLCRRRGPVLRPAELAP